MNVPWGIIVPQGPHLRHSTSARLEHGVTRHGLSELISAQNVLPGNSNKKKFYSTLEVEIIYYNVRNNYVHYDYTL